MSDIVQYIQLTPAELDNRLFQAAKQGAEVYKDKLMKDTSLKTKEVANRLKVSVPTVLKFIQEGIKGGIKLIAIQFDKDYRVSEYELEQFKNHLRNK